jgi:hypothetical protein
VKGVHEIKILCVSRHECLEISFERKELDVGALGDRLAIQRPLWRWASWRGRGAHRVVLIAARVSRADRSVKEGQILLKFLPW